MSYFHQDFIRFAIEQDVLCFGEFKTKSGRTATLTARKSKVMIKVVARLMVEARKWDFSETTSRKDWLLVMMKLVKHMQNYPHMYILEGMKTVLDA